MFLSTMQDEPLSLATLLRYGTTVHGRTELNTWTPGGVSTLTFAELGLEAAQLANALEALGVGEGDRVGTYMWNNNAHMVAYCAVPAMGAVLHTLNIRLFADQNAYIANHAGDKVVIVDESLADQFAAVLPELSTVEHVIVNGDASSLAVPSGVSCHSYRDVVDSQAATFDWPVIDERAAAAACYTSGTTGDPKGVMYSHRSIWLHSLQVCASYGMGLSADDDVLAIVPMFHAMSWGIPHAALMTGARLTLPERFLQPPHLTALMAERRPTLAAAVPTVWFGVLQHIARNPQDLSHLRHVVVGGSAVPPSLTRDFADRHGVDIIQAWGMTETSPLGSVAWAPPDVHGDEAWDYRFTQGRLLPGIQARLVDDDDNVVDHDGTSVGELEVKGPWITGRYHSSDPNEVPDPSKFRNGWLRTGDIGSITSDGYLSLKDRSKDVIKSGGEWISSVELENAVMSHPAVAEAAVIGVPDPKWDERPLVAVVLKPGASAEPEELRDHLASHFAQWQLPDHWSFIDEVPKTSVGKFDKKRLRSAYQAGDLAVTTR